MTDRPEKLFVVKERYLLLTDNDFTKAELLYRFDIHQDWKQIGISELASYMTLPIGHSTLRRKLQELIDQGLLEKDTDTKPYRYRVCVRELESQVRALGLILLNGVVVKVDDLASFNTSLVYIDEKDVLKSSASLAQNERMLEKDVLKSSACEENQDPLSITSPSIYKTTDVNISKNPNSNTDDVPNNSNTLSNNLISKKKKKPRKHYTWKHYAKFNREVWTKAREELSFPERESSRTFLIGAYLIGIHSKQGLTIQLSTGDYNKYMVLAGHMLEFFTFKNSGNQVQGFSDALDWIKEYVAKPTDSFAGKNHWSIGLCFQADQYRLKGMKSREGKKINDTGIVISTPEQRKEAIDNARRIVDGKIV